jgi:hypothetical protein
LTPLGGQFQILSIAPFPKHERASLTLIQGKIGFLKMRKMTIFALKPNFPPESGSKKPFYALGMRAIDYPHKIIPRGGQFQMMKKTFFEKFHV